MDLKLAIDIYNEKINMIKRLELEKQILGKGILSEINSSNEFSRLMMFTNLTKDSFESQINKLIDFGKIEKVEKISCLGDGRNETSVKFDFVFDSKKFAIEIPKQIYNIDNINFTNIFMIRVFVYENDFCLTQIGKIDDILCLCKILKSYQGKSIKDLIKIGG